MTKTQFNQPHRHPSGHTFSINDDGTEVRLTFHGDDDKPVVISGEDAKALHNWLDAAALRTQEEADALTRQD